MPLHIASKRANEDGFNIAVSGQGADELFGGYTKYLKNYTKLNSKTQDILYDDIKNSYHVNLERDNAITNFNNISLKAPFMDKTMINLAMKIPIKYKIKSNDDQIRKHILRDVAIELGVPEFIAMRPKKAAQYGSGVHKLLIKKILPNFDERTFMDTLRKPRI
jgi:asparagine synthase (glutamine-hydrolysing)